MVRKATGRAGNGRGKSREMSSAVAAAALGAFMSGAGTSDSPAQAAIAPQERAGAIQAYRIPAGSMAAALNVIADENGLHVLYDARLTDGLKTPGLSGNYALRDALGNLLADTGLEYRISGDGHAVSIVLAQNDSGARSDASGAEPLPTIDVGAAQPVSGVGAGSGEGGGGSAGARASDPTTYNPPNATTATKTDTPIMETPVSIQVVPQQVMLDQQVTRLDKALENVSGVYAVPSGAGFGASSDMYLIRGFFADRIYRDGVLQPQVAACCPIPNELADVDHVEVLKGPASILYGRIEPGGLINMVTKQPLSQPFHALEQQFGSFSSNRPSADLGGPVGKDSRLFYRFNMSYENAKSFVDFAKTERFFIAPALRWEIDGATQVTFNMHYLNTRDPYINGIPVFGGPPQIPAWLPRSTNFYALPRSSNTYENPKNYLEDVYVGYNFSHDFNEHWTLRQRFSANFFKGNSDEQFPIGPVDADGFLPRAVLNEHFRDTLWQTSADLTGRFSTWQAKHTLLVGADYLNQSPHNTGANYDLSSAINIFTGAQQGDIAPLSPTIHNYTHPEWFGLYLQDNIELPYGFHVLAGLRYDNARNRNYYAVEDGSAPSVNTVHDTAVNPRFGLLWRPIPEISFYGSYVTNFGLPNGLFQSGNVKQSLPPTTAEQYEAGVKTELFDQRLSASFAYFNLIKRNIPTQDPFNPMLTDVTGEVRSRGVELDVAGQILPGWRVIGGIAFTDAVITKDSIDATGAPLGNQGKLWYGVPRVGGSVWTTYEFEDGDLRGLKFGAGLVSRNNREGDLANTWVVPGFTVVNTMAGYEWKWGNSKIKLQLNVDNLFDRKYFVNSDGWISAFYGAPRTFKGSIRVEY
jgi:iron complex outermembrane recepter protein